MDVREAAGKRITKLWYGPQDYGDIMVDVPDSNHLFTFDLRVPDGPDLLVLDPYGDDAMSETIASRIFGPNGRHTVAIDRKTGDIHTVNLCIKDNALAFNIHWWMPTWGSNRELYRIPKQWRSRIEELRLKKRPYRCWIQPEALMSFINQEIGYEHLKREVVFAFDFDGGGELEVWGGSYRRANKWKPTG